MVLTNAEVAHDNYTIRLNVSFYSLIHVPFQNLSTYIRTRNSVTKVSGTLIFQCFCCGTLGTYQRFKKKKKMIYCNICQIVEYVILIAYSWLLYNVIFWLSSGFHACLNHIRNLQVSVICFEIFKFKQIL